MLLICSWAQDDNFVNFNVAISRSDRVDVEISDARRATSTCESSSEMHNSVECRTPRR